MMESSSDSGDGVGAARRAGDDAHGAIGVAGQAGLAERGGKFDGAMRMIEF